MSNPFGAPTEEMMDFKVPDESEDPFRPIGKYDDTGKHIGGTPQKAQAVGKCIALTPKEGPSGPMAVFTIVVTEGDYAGREFELYCSYSPRARFKIVETYKAFGLPLDGPFPKSAAVGVYVLANLKDEEYNGRWSAKLQGLAPHPKGVGFRGAGDLSDLPTTRQQEDDIPF